MTTRMYAILAASFICMITSANVSKANETTLTQKLEINLSTPAEVKQYAAVHFLGHESDLSFTNSDKTDVETNDGSKWCRNNGYGTTSCAGMTALTDRCPKHPVYYKSCTAAQWCLNNNYRKLSSSCVRPKFPNPVCPGSDAYARDCVEDIPRACKEQNSNLVHSSTCAAGWTLQSSPRCTFDNQYGICCNLCGGYDYTSIPDGYVSAGSCSSCSGTKYKITCNPCAGYTTCEYGPDVGSGTCNSCGTTKYNKCKTTRQVCAGKGFDQTSCGSLYDTTTCPDDGTYKKCTPTCESKLTEAGYTVNADSYNAIITKSMTLYSANSSKLRSVESFRSTYPTECSTSRRPKPTLTLSLSSGTSLTYKNYENMNMIINTSVTMNGTTFTNVPLTVNGNITLNSGSFYHNTDSNKPKSSLNASNISVSGGARFQTSYADINLRGLFIWNTSPVWISNSTFRASFLETITSDSRTEFSGSSTYVYVGRTFIGGLENYGGGGVYRRGAVIRVRDSAKWYMSSGIVRMRDGALFCAGNSGKIYFSGTTKGFDWGEYDGCRIYHDKDREISYGDWDPSKYTSWSNRGGC